MSARSIAFSAPMALAAAIRGRRCDDSSKSIGSTLQCVLCTRWPLPAAAIARSLPTPSHGMNSTLTLPRHGHASAGYGGPEGSWSRSPLVVHAHTEEAPDDSILRVGAVDVHAIVTRRIHRRLDVEGILNPCSQRQLLSHAVAAGEVDVREGPD